MLKTRVITAVILAIAFLSVLFFPISWPFYAFCGAALTVAAWEWTALAGLTHFLGRALFAGFVAVLIAVVTYQSLVVLPEHALLPKDWLLVSLACVMLIWPLLFVFIVRYPKTEALWNNAFFKLLLALFITAQSWASLIWIREQPYYLYLIVYSIVLVTFSDIAAYFTGRRFGRIKLAANVSPGKSWEGVIGGAFAALSIACMAFYAFGEKVFPGMSLWQMLLIAMTVSLVSVVGDLSMSLFKRSVGLKDSGSILPGHGGILDRIDGMQAALPVFVFLMILVN